MELEERLSTIRHKLVDIGRVVENEQKRGVDVGFGSRILSHYDCDDRTEKILGTFFDEYVKLIPKEKEAEDKFQDATSQKYATYSNAALLIGFLGGAVAGAYVGDLFGLKDFAFRCSAVAGSLAGFLVAWGSEHLYMRRASARGACVTYRGKGDEYKDLIDKTAKEIASHEGAYLEIKKNTVK